MSFIQTASNTCGKYLASKVPNDQFPSVEDQISVYSYGFQALLGGLVKVFLLLSVSWLLGVIVPSVVIAITFASFRVIAGGYHMKTFGRCMIISLGMFLVAALIAQYTNISNIILLTLAILTVVTGLYIIYRYVPRDTPTKPITKPEDIRKFKRWSLIYLAIWAIIMTLLMVLLVGTKVIILSSSLGLLLELFSISKMGMKFFSIVDNN